MRKKGQNFRELLKFKIQLKVNILKDQIGNAKANYSSILVKIRKLNN